MPASTLYEYYTSQGQKLPSVQDRSKIYEQAGLGSASSYSGTASQNTSLLSYLQGSGGSTSGSTGGSTPTGIITDNVTGNQYYKDASGTYRPYTGGSSGSTSGSTSSSPSSSTSTLSGESILNYLSGNSAVGTSSSARTEDKVAEAEKLAQTLSQIMGGYPQAPDLVSPEQQAMLPGLQLEAQQINDELASIANERLAIQDELDKFAQQQVGLPEAGRRGAISEEERNATFRLRELERREITLEMKLSNRNNTINQIMTGLRTEYTDAVAQYQTNYNIFKEAYNLLDQESDELKADAKANLGVLTNLYAAQIETGQLGGLTNQQKIQLETLEMQAGLPIGSTSAIIEASIAAGPELTYKGTLGSAATGYSALFIDGNGNPVVKPLIGGGGTDDGTPPTSTPSTADRATYKTIADAFIKQNYTEGALTFRTKELASAIEDAIAQVQSIPVGTEIEGGGTITQAWKDGVIQAIQLTGITREEANRIRSLELQ